jgi:hypothetical protein
MGTVVKNRCSVRIVNFHRVQLVSQHSRALCRRLLGRFLHSLEFRFVPTCDPDTFRISGVPDHRRAAPLVLPLTSTHLVLNDLPDRPRIGLVLVLLPNPRRVDCAVQRISHP